LGQSSSMTPTRVTPAKAVIQMVNKFPKLIVFDLDYTLWPYWCDTHFITPLRREGDFIYGRSGIRHEVYPDSDSILRSIHENPAVKLACASRTGAIDIAKTLLRLLKWDELFDYMEIYPGSKVKHFESFHRLSGIPYYEMIFFDDEDRNIRDVSQLGVHSYLVENGMTVSLLHQALKRFERDTGFQ
ncbi:hypothetical protein CRM22_001495, partial [Opisthorchis felineus]